MAQNAPEHRAGLSLTTGERIHILRVRAHLTKRELALAARTSNSSMGRYEADEIPAPSDVLGRIAMKLDTTSDYLLGLTEDPTVPDPDSPSRVWVNGEVHRHPVAA
jgi:transcriptional regulator with XRE-family HTH domain